MPPLTSGLKQDVRSAGTPLMGPDPNSGTGNTRVSGITDEDRRTALRFVLGRPGWRVEAWATAQGETCLGLTTPCRDTGGQRSWRLVRTTQGLLVCDEASGQPLCATPTMREALVEIWEATAEAASG